MSVFIVQSVKALEERQWNELICILRWRRKKETLKAGRQRAALCIFNAAHPAKCEGNIRLFDALSEIRIVSVHLPHVAEARFRLDAGKMYALLPLAGLRLKSKSAPSAVCDTAYE